MHTIYDGGCSATVCADAVRLFIWGLGVCRDEVCNSANLNLKFCRGYCDDNLNLEAGEMICPKYARSITCNARPYSYLLISLF